MDDETSVQRTMVPLYWYLKNVSISSHLTYLEPFTQPIRQVTATERWKTILSPTKYVAVRCRTLWNCSF